MCANDDDYLSENVEIKADAEEENALVTGDGVVSLSQGLNEKRVIVTSENGDVKTYTIEITRNNPITSKLKNIKVRNYSLDPIFESERETGVLLSLYISFVEINIISFDKSIK